MRQPSRAIVTGADPARRRVYEERLAAGIAREQARKDLPLSTYTEAYWKIDLHNLLHFLALRMDTHAQLEIRRYAETIGHEIVQPLFPLVWEAFLDYRVEAMRLTKLDRGVIARLVAQSGGRGFPASRADFLVAQDASWQGLERCRERDECLDKLVELKQEFNLTYLFVAHDLAAVGYIRGGTVIANWLGGSLRISIIITLTVPGVALGDMVVGFSFGKSQADANAQVIAHAFVSAAGNGADGFRPTLDSVPAIRREIFVR